MVYTYPQALTIIEAIGRQDYMPNDFEMDFMDSIDNHTDLTEKQTVCLNEIYARATDECEKGKPDKGNLGGENT